MEKKRAEQDLTFYSRDRIAKSSLQNKQTNLSEDKVVTFIPSNYFESTLLNLIPLAYISLPTDVPGRNK